jgi:hypothetical protein
MNRRNFLQSTGALCAGLALTKSIPVFADTSQTGGGWQTFEVTTRVEVLKPTGVTHIWLPAALIRDTPFQRTHTNKFSAEGGAAKFSKDKPNALGIVAATYPANAKAVLTLTSQVSLKTTPSISRCPAERRAFQKKSSTIFFSPAVTFLPTAL